MSVVDKEIKIIKLNDERLKLIKIIKNSLYFKDYQTYVRRINEINREIEELLK